MITFGSLFSGIGGFDLGFERAGMECAWQCEIDKPAQGILNRHFGVEVFDDIRTIEAKRVDVICGGFPCQDLSIAGKRKGLDGERSGLWFEFAKVIDRLEPKWVVIENVPGLLSSNKGRDFAVILRWLVERGYGVSWRVLDAQYFGVAQRRRRVFIVGSLGSGRSTEVLLESEGMRWDPPTRGEKGQGIANSFTIRSGKEGGGKGYLGKESLAMTLGGQKQLLEVSGTLDAKSSCSSNRGSQSNETDFLVARSITTREGQRMDDTLETLLPCWEMQHASEAYRESGEISPNLQARMGTGGNNVPLVGVRRLTPTECERLQGFPDGWTDGQSDVQRYKQLGNAVCVNVAEWIGKRIVEADK